MQNGLRFRFRESHELGLEKSEKYISQIVHNLDKGHIFFFSTIGPELSRCDPWQVGDVVAIFEAEATLNRENKRKRVFNHFFITNFQKQMCSGT